MGCILSSRGLNRRRTQEQPDTISREPRFLKTNAATARDNVGLAARTLDEHKGLEIVILDLRQLCDATDYFVVATGTSDTHVRALAEHVAEALRRDGRRPHHVEGVSGGRWALLDYVDFVIHIFHPTLRDYYQLERLWADAPSVSAGSTR